MPGVLPPEKVEQHGTQQQAVNDKGHQPHPFQQRQERGNADPARDRCECHGQDKLLPVYGCLTGKNPCCAEQAGRRDAAAFPQKVREVRDYWTDFVRSRHAAGKRVAIWGGGSKGVSFLTTNGLGEEVADVIDINPHKQGKFLPVTAHRVTGPEALRDEPPDTVIVMNPIYLPEIGADLAKLGLNPELVAV